jgi:hypothetical protein
MNVEHNPEDWEDFEAAARRPIEQHVRNSFIRTYRPVLVRHHGRVSPLVQEQPAHVARLQSRLVPAMATFEFRNAQEIGRVCGRYGVKYLFFGKSGAILLGYSDTTQDVYLYVEAPCGEAWLPGRQYRRHHREQAGGKPPERQGIAASSVVVPGVVEKKSLGRVLSHVPAKARSRGWA